MKAAMVITAGQNPVYGDFANPVPAAGQSLVQVRAAAISQVTRSRASGKHYSASSVLPFVPGVDGVGVNAHGQRVYFLMPEAPYGAMAELCSVSSSHCCSIPEGLSDVDAAAMAIPGMSAWAALLERAKLQLGETVLVNGATGTSGRLAIQIARHLGAKKVIATGRQTQMFDELEQLGADVTIGLSQNADALSAALQAEFAEGVDVVLDYLWGSSAEALIVAAAQASPEGSPVRFVQIGAMSGNYVNLPSAALRSSGLLMMGSGIGSVPFARMLAAIEGVLNAAPAAGFKVATQTMPLAEVSAAWLLADGPARLVLQP